MVLGWVEAPRPTERFQGLPLPATGVFFSRVALIVFPLVSSVLRGRFLAMLAVRGGVGDASRIAIALCGFARMARLAMLVTSRRRRAPNHIGELREFLIAVLLQKAIVLVLLVRLGSRDLA